MYFLLLFLVAFLLISLFSTNWPVKFYHHYLLQKLGMELNCQPQKNGLTLSNIYSQIDTVFRGRKLKIRFVEGTIDALKTNSGLEIRVKTVLKEVFPAVMGIYQLNRQQREWGDFKRLTTGDSLLDTQWFILTDNLQAASDWWGKSQFVALLSGTPYLEQIQINHDEIIVRLRRFHSAKQVVAFLDQLSNSIPM